MKIVKDKIIVRRYVSPYGILLLGDWAGYLCLCDWEYARHRNVVDQRIEQFLGAKMQKGLTEITEKAVSQLEEYFLHQRTDFDLPILLCGTDFQRKVWQTLSAIHYAETISYGQLSAKMEMPSAARAVANAVGANALVIIVPCHRVVGAGGALGGYSGGVDLKRRLLMLERMV